MNFSLALVLICISPVLLSGQDAVIEELSEHSGRDISEDLEDLRVDRLDLNTVSGAELLRIPWIDDHLAERMVEYRRVRGGYRRLQELRNVAGVTPHLYDLISPYLTIEARLEGVVRVDSRQRGSTVNRRLRAALSRGWFSTGFRATRSSGGGTTTTTGYLSLAPPLLRGARVTIGGMYLRLGQGLLSWPSFGAQRYSGRPIVYPLEKGGIRGTTSGDAGRVVRGGGVSRDGRLWSFGLVAGRSGSGADGSTICALQCAVRLRSRLEAGVNILSQENDSPKTSLTVRAELPKILLFAEAAVSGQQGSAGLVGLKKRGRDCALLLLYRRHSPVFHSGLGFDMSSPRTGTGNLRALYLAFTVRPWPGVALTAYVDTGTREATDGHRWLDRFQEFSFMGRLKPYRGVTSALALTVKRVSDQDRRGAWERTAKLKWDTSLSPVPGLEMGMRWYLVHGAGDRAWRSSLLSLRIKREHVFGFTCRAWISLFHCTPGGSLYLVEGGLPERSLFLRLSGDGERYALVVTRNITDCWTIRWKASRTTQFETEERGGFELGHWQSESPRYEFQLEVAL